MKWVMEMNTRFNKLTLKDAYMKMYGPQKMKQLDQVDDFYAYANRMILKEFLIVDIESCDQGVDDGVFFRIEIRNSLFSGCSFQNCNFEGATFVDVVFKSCDLSNSKFTGAYFERCHFVSCKCVGANMSDTVVKQTIFEHANLKYAHFDQTRMTDVQFEQVDFTEASMTDAKLKRFEAIKSRFVKNNFFKTALAMVDFSDNELIAPMVSMPPVELKGAVINMFQAADLIGLWGVIVKR